MNNNSKNGYSAFNAGSLNENNAAMTELWQSKIEQILATRKWDLELDEKCLIADIQNLAQSFLNMALEAAWQEMPIVASDVEFDICIQMGKGIYRAAKYGRLDKHVKWAILETFKKDYNLTKTGGQRRFFKDYLKWKKSQIMK